MEDKDSQLEKMKDKVTKLEEEIKDLKVENAQHKPLAQAQSQVQAQSEAQAQVEDEDGIVKWEQGISFRVCRYAKTEHHQQNKVKVQYDC